MTTKRWIVSLTRHQRSAIGLVFMSLLLFGSVRSSASGPAPQSESQFVPPAPEPVRPAEGGHPVLVVPAYAPHLTADDALSRRTGKYLHRHRFPYVNAQVFRDEEGAVRSIVLTGQVRTEFGRRDAEQKARDFLNNPGLAVENQIGLNAEAGRLPPPEHEQVGSELGAQVLMLRQGGYVSRRLLGCWHGTTAERPTEWRVLSPLGMLVRYHRDNINVCLAWKDQNLTVTDEQWSCAGCRYTAGLRVDYHIVSATGDEVTLAEEEFDGSAPTGRLRTEFKLNPDDTIEERIDKTGYLGGHPIFRAGTTAHLQRKHG